jgi:hypothetical protein
MILEVEVQQKLAAVANDELPLFDFADWLDSKSWSMHRDSSPEAVKLVSLIERLFAEYDLGMDEARLRQRILSLLARQVFEIAFVIEPDRVVEAKFPITVAASRTIRQPVRLQPRLALS